METFYVAKECFYVICQCEINNCSLVYNDYKDSRGFCIQFQFLWTHGPTLIGISFKLKMQLFRFKTRLLLMKIREWTQSSVRFDDLYKEIIYD